MGLFGKLFEKKECAFCGGEIGLFGNRKLEDGNMCKECANKLSPWFDDRRHSTVEQIAEQLEYREANREKVAAFEATLILGDETKVLLDEDACVFLVTSERDICAANPDVIDFSDVTGCKLDVDETHYELTHINSEGESVSYRPPRYRYSYDFYLTIYVRNPYFEEIRFKLNRGSVDMESGYGLMGSSPAMNAEYRSYQEMGEEIKRLLMEARQQSRDEAAAAAAPQTPVICSCCGATTLLDESGCCEYCGVALEV